MAEYELVKHLELISKAIERMEKASSALKALSPAAFAVALVLIERKVPAWLALVGSAAAVVAYWYMDAQYFGRERSFRRLYDEARLGKLQDDPYDMEIGRRYGKQSARECMKLDAVYGVHVVTLTLIAIAFVAISILGGSQHGA